MNNLKSVTSLAMIAIATAYAIPATAQGISVQFQESAPKDRFIIVNQTDCSYSQMNLSIDLKDSAAGLLFDTQSGGAGINVYQPLEVAVGSQWISRADSVQDGASQLELTISEFPSQERITITIDVDDTQPLSPLGTQMISNSEIAGAEVRIKVDDVSPMSSRFNAEGKLNVDLKCTTDV